MATKTTRGSGGRLDWEEAFAFFVRLPAGERSYQAVADHYRVSVRTVERRGRDGKWRQRLRGLQAEAAEAINVELREGLIESLTNALKLAEATYSRYAQQLQAGTVKVTPSDLARMVALQQLITDSISTLAAAAANDRIAAEPTTHVDRAAHELEVLQALHDAGAIDRILTRLNNPEPKETR